MHTRSSVGHEAEARAALPSQRAGLAAPPVEVTGKMQKRYVALKVASIAVRLRFSQTPSPMR